MRVNGTVVREPGVRVEPDRDRVLVHGRPIPGRATLRYFMLHKPVGFLTTLKDPEGRRTVRQLLPPGPRLFPVGRLDADTSGLLVFTNDGELAHRLMHPRFGVTKLYRVTLKSPPSQEALRRLREGVEIEPGQPRAPAEVRVRSARVGRAAIEIRIHEGRYRQVRRMCEVVGLEVRKLHRFGYGPLRLEKLPMGACRALTRVEMSRLRATSARPGGTGPPATAPALRRKQPPRLPRLPRPPRPPRFPRTAPAAQRREGKFRSQKRRRFGPETQVRRGEARGAAPPRSTPGVGQRSVRGGAPSATRRSRRVAGRGPGRLGPPRP